MMKNFKLLLITALTVLVPAFLLGCQDAHTDMPVNETADTSLVDTVLPEHLTADEQMPDSQVFSQQQIDSLTFRLTHHYSVNFNFLVKADSLQLVPQEGDFLSDTTQVYKGELLVVAEIKRTESNPDSLPTYLVKVAHDQQTMGWINEADLLRGTVPNDSISQLLDFLASSRAIWMSSLIGLGLVGLLIYKRGHRARDYVLFVFSLDSFCTTFFLMLVASLAALYASVQNFVPEFWQEYYYHPTLNPLLLPGVMSILVTLVWLIIIAYVAVVIEVYNHFFFLRGMAYLLEVSGMAMLIYLFISWTTLIYIGYLLLPLLLGLLLLLYFRYGRCKYICGKCGHKIHKLGACPYCGAINE